MMLIFLITYVVPKFADLFNNLDAQAAGHHGVHAGGRAERAEVCAGSSLLVLVAAGVSVVALERDDRGAERIDRVDSVAAADRAKSG